jgi:hypothetical protein
VLQRRDGNELNMQQEWIREGELKEYLRINLRKVE